MVVQTSTDEEKLNSIKKNARKRPFHVTPSQKTRELPSSLNGQTGGSSDDVDSLFDQPINYTDRTPSPSIHMNKNDKYQGRSSSIAKSIESVSTVQSQTDHIDYNNINKQDVDCASVTSSEWGAESERGEPTSRQSNATIKRKLKQKTFFFNEILSRWFKTKSSITYASYWFNSKFT